jgi:hypothetical protein
MVPTLEKIQHDERAMTVAAVLALANLAAVANGTDLSGSLITITEEPTDHLWQVHYGPRDYKNRRGGDLMIFVDDRLGEVQKIQRGQ